MTRLALLPVRALLFVGVVIAGLLTLLGSKMAFRAGYILIAWDDMIIDRANHRRSI